MARLTVQFAGRPPYEARVVGVAPRPGAPRVDRGALRVGDGGLDNEVTLNLPPGRYRLRLSAGNAVELRWIDLSKRGRRIFCDPPDDGPTTWRGPLNVRSQRRGQGDGVISPRAVGVLLHREAVFDGDFLEALGFRRVQGEVDDSQVALNGFIALHERALDPVNSSALAQLRAHPAVAAAGPLDRDGDDFSIFRPHLFVQFRSGVARDIAQGMLARMRPRAVKALPGAPRLYRVELSYALGSAINAYVATLVADPRVAFAEPGFGDRPILHAPPADFLWPMLWDRQQLNLEAALDVAGADAAVEVAVIDDSFLDVVEHPELSVISAPTDDGNRHGMACMGLIAAVADTDGLIGIAPDAQLTPVIYSSTGEMHVSLGYAATADVISASVGVRTYTPGMVEVELIGSTRLRDGRGIAQFFSAGNDGAISLLSTSFGSSDFSFATSGVSQAGLKLTNGNSGSQMAWCTPAGDSGGFPTNWATATPDTGTLPAEETWSLTVLQLDTNVPPNPNRCRVAGPVPVIHHGFVIAATPTAASLPARIIAADDAVSWAATGSGWIELDSVVPIGVGEAFVLGARRLGTVQSNVFSGQVIGVDWHVPLTDVGDTIWVGYEGDAPTTQYVLDPTNGAINGAASLVAPIDAPVFAAHAVFAMTQHARSFGASSAANALAAGVGALVLRANPELTFREVEEILKETAVSLGSTADFGAGRLDAFAAVERATEYIDDDRADLHIRDLVGDQGNGASAPMSTSPDIWVRQTAGAGPAVGYAQAGPHEDPIAAQTNYVYVRLKNRGGRTSPTARVLLHVAAPSLAPFDWPTAWLAGDTPTTQTIGDPIDIPPLAPGAETTVEFIWPASDMLTDIADPWLLAEVTPQDGALAEPQVHRNTNLATRPVSVIDSGGVGPQVSWRDAASQPLGFGTGPVALTVQAHMPGGEVAYAAFHAHGRRRADDLPETLVFSSPTWDAAAGAYEFSIGVPDTWAEFVLEAEVIDSLGRVAPSDQRFHRMAVRLPIEVTLLLDRSGSMSDSAGSMSKWAAARRSAYLFDSIFSVFKDPADVFKAIGFQASGGFQVTGTTLAALPAGNPSGGTPLGQAVRHGAMDPTDGFSSGTVGERVLVLLTDGKQNGTPSLEDVRVPGAAGNPTSVTEDALHGVRIHACAFGAPGAVDTDTLEGLVHGGDDPSLNRFAGRLQSTENLDDADNAGALTEMFLSVVSDVTGAEMVGPIRVDGEAFVIEPGVDKALFIAPTGPAGLLLVHPDGVTTTALATINDPDGNFSHAQVALLAPTPGTWTLQGAPTSDCFVLVDLQLTSNFAVEPTLDGGFDCAVTLLFAGQPITNANCELRAYGPGESIGEAIINAGVRLREARKPRYRSRRGLLLDGALKRRGRQKLLIARNTHLLQPTGVGRFAATLDGPLRTGTWSFELKVTGQTPSGAPFERLIRASRVIAARPDTTTTDVQWATLPNGNQQVVITPRDRRGDRLGPGLDLKTFAQGVGHALIDRGNGTYTATFKSRTALALSRRLGTRIVPAPPPRIFAVRVVVTQVRVDAVRGGRAADNWVFVARANVGRRRKSTRFPNQGAMRPNTPIAAGNLIVDERVLDGERLTLRLAGYALDRNARWAKTLRHARPGVTATGMNSLRLDGDPRRWAGTHRIGEQGWQVEVRIEVDG